VRDELTFDDLESLKPAEVPFSYGGTRYVLREASGEAAASWKAAQLRAHRPTADGKLLPTPELVETEPLLVSLCLYRADASGGIPADKAGGPCPKALVPAKEVKALPSRVQRFLFEQAQKISRLGQYEEDLARMKALRTYLDERIGELEAAQREGGPGN
jgi:hypothetical protein